MTANRTCDNRFGASILDVGGAGRRGVRDGNTQLITRDSGHGGVTMSRTKTPLKRPVCPVSDGFLPDDTRKIEELAACIVNPVI